ncbi:MAG: S1 RNA-binding domain-containing protein, partial [Pseudomonadota bacterium]
MTETFRELFEKSLSSIDMRPGAVFDGVVLSINKNTGYVVVDTPLKSEGYVKLEEFLDAEGNLEIAVGDKVPVVLEAVEDGWGETRLSRLRAKRKETWHVLESAFTKGEVIMGVIHGKVKGGFTVDIN